jgi:hypothetical protein
MLKTGLWEAMDKSHVLDFKTDFTNGEECLCIKEKYQLLRTKMDKFPKWKYILKKRNEE